MLRWWYVHTMMYKWMGGGVLSSLEREEGKRMEFAATSMGPEYSSVGTGAQVMRIRCKERAVDSTAVRYVRHVLPRLWLLSFISPSLPVFRDHCPLFVPKTCMDAQPVLPLPSLPFPFMGPSPSHLVTVTRTWIAASLSSGRHLKVNRVRLCITT